MNNFIQKILNMLKNLYNKKALYYLYFVGLAVIVVAFDFDDDTQIIVSLLGLFIVLVPAICDFYKIATKIIQNKVIIFIINFILFYIIYGVAEILSKEHIRVIVDFMPNSYTTTIYFFAIFYTLYISIVLFIIVLVLLLFVCFMFSMLKENKWVKKLQDYIVKKFGFQNRTHMSVFYLLD